MLSIFTLPTSTAIISGVSAYSNDFFTEFLPLVYIAVGILAAAMLVMYVRKTVSAGIAKATGSRRKGGRRRR